MSLVSIIYFWPIQATNPCGVRTAKDDYGILQQTKALIRAMKTITGQTRIEDLVLVELKDTA